MPGKIVLKKNEEKRVLGGHKWVFSNEVSSVSGSPLSGDITELYSAEGNFLGQGFYNGSSLISFRLITESQAAISAGFWKERIEVAYLYRKSIYPELDSYRVVYGESDGLPGLVVDKYSDYLSVQFLAAGMEKIGNEIVAVLAEVYGPKGIVAKNDSSLRTMEGLEEKTEVLYGTVPEKIKINEHGRTFIIDLITGQKTGFFYDQRENRAAVSRFSKGRNVLDCFCYTGGFGVSALVSGAEKAVFVDSSKPALDIAGENAVLNGCSGKYELVKSGADEYLNLAKESGRKFDVVIIDPPAFIRSKKHFNAGYKAYRKINSLAMECVSPGGVLATSSCSHNLFPGDFRQMLKEAASKARREFVAAGFFGQAPDHPVLLAMPETDYLKFALLKAVN